MKQGCQQGGHKENEQETIGQLRGFAQLVAEGSWVEATLTIGDASREPMAKPDLRKMLIPLGTVVVFGASNFPLAYSTAGGDTAAALAAGCPVIVKSHPMHAGTGALVAAAIINAAQKTGMPNGVFSNLLSSGYEVGQQLVAHPKVKAVGFTGSIKGGRALLDIASKREEPIPVFAEMGSINPVVMLPEALHTRGEALAKIYASSITLGTGQFCTNPGLILAIKSDALTSFIATLTDEILALSPTCMLHPAILQAYKHHKTAALSKEGMHTEAYFSEEVPPNFAAQVIASVDGKTFMANKTLHKEVFGPYSLVVVCEDNIQLEEIITQLEGQLTGTIIAEDDEINKYDSLVKALQNRVGRLIFNGVPTGVEVSEAMVHGGPYPASTDSRFTAVGVSSIKRWVRPFTYQDWPNESLPDALKNENPLKIDRVIDGKRTKDSIV